MHPTAYDLGRLVFQTHWRDGFHDILDVGSLDVNGTLRDFCPRGARYLGIDLEAGPGVDLVLEDPYTYPFTDDAFDMIVSTSCFEHDPMFWLTFLEMSRVLRDGGVLYINAPSTGQYHTHPWDNWRFYPDAALALEMWANRSNLNVVLLESFTLVDAEPWNDTVMIFYKGDPGSGRPGFISDAVKNATHVRRHTTAQESSCSILYQTPITSGDAVLLAARSGRVLNRTTLAELLGSGDTTRVAAGVQSADLLASAGHYVRRAAQVSGLDEGTPVGAKYREQLKRTSEHYPPLFHTVMNRAVVTGQGTVVTQNYALIADSCWEMLEQRRLPEGLERSDDDNLMLKQAPSRRIERPSLLLKRPWWRNYGHWLLDSAALLALLPGLAMPEEWQIVIGRHDDPKMRQIAYEALSFLAPSVPIVEHQDNETWLFDELHYTTPVSKPPFFKLPQAIAALRSLVLSGSFPNFTIRRLYVARASGRPRPLENEQEIQDLCVESGFQVIEPENYTLRQQAQLFNGAEIIVGIKGAALTNLIFCDSAATVIVLSPDSWAEPFFWDIAGQSGIRYIEVVGKTTAQTDSPATAPFVINRDLFLNALDQAEHEGSIQCLIGDLGVGAPLVGGLVESTPEGPGESAANTGMVPDLEPQPTGSIFVHIHNLGDVEGKAGEWIGTRGSSQWIEGVMIVPEQAIANDEVEYCVTSNFYTWSDWVRGGEYSGTRGQSLPIRGLRIRLKGSAAESFECRYSGSFTDGTEVQGILDGEVCASESLAPLSAVQIVLRRRGYQPAMNPPHEELSPAQLMMKFESLGDNCEFGLVQRHFGAEPLGLLRFAGFHIPLNERIPALISALAAGFKDVGQPGSIEITVEGPQDEYIVRESTYRLMYHTFLGPKDLEREQLVRMEETRLSMLRRKLEDDLRHPRKIFIWKSNSNDGSEDVNHLYRVLRGIGNHVLFWVGQAVPGYEVGEVRVVEGSLLRGSVRRLAPYGNAGDIDYQPWLTVCEKAYDLARSIGACGS